MTVKTKSRIDKITIKHETDDNPDLSYLGEYSNEYKPFAINREKQGDKLRNEYKYFIPAQARYAKEDYKRMESYNKGHWQMIGIKAKAEVSYGIGNGCRRIEWFTSSGLWGIESDSDEAYIKEIEQEQLADLKAHLQQFGVDVSDFDSKVEVS